MSVARKILSIYRSFQYKLFGRHKYGIMPNGVECHVEPFMYDINHGDIVHPCVRYIPEGFEGHKWWMVYTPYYNADATIENPILCYSESNAPLAPKDWRVYGLVNERPGNGYNSDPNLLYEKGKLYVYWRENHSPNALDEGYERATYVASVEKGKFVKQKVAVVGTTDSEWDPETSPTFIKSPEGYYCCYATYIRFHSPFFRSIIPSVRKFTNPLLNVLAVLGVWNQQRSKGVAVWKCSSPMGKYLQIKTMSFKNMNKLYIPWHMDLFEYHGTLFAIVQSNQCNADILLARCDGESFVFFDKPLITNATCGKIGIYKPCACVVNDIFYLFYTAQDLNNRALNRLYLASVPWSDLMEKL